MPTEVPLPIDGRFLPINVYKLPCVDIEAQDIDPLTLSIQLQQVVMGVQQHLQCGKGDIFDNGDQGNILILKTPHGTNEPHTEVNIFTQGDAVWGLYVSRLGQLHGARPFEGGIDLGEPQDLRFANPQNLFESNSPLELHQFRKVLNEVSSLLSLF